MARWTPTTPTVTGSRPTSSGPRSPRRPTVPPRRESARTRGFRPLRCVCAALMSRDATGEGRGRWTVTMSCTPTSCSATRRAPAGRSPVGTRLGRCRSPSPHPTPGRPMVSGQQVDAPRSAAARGRFPSGAGAAARVVGDPAGGPAGVRPTCLLGALQERHVEPEPPAPKLPWSGPAREGRTDRGTTPGTAAVGGPRTAASRAPAPPCGHARTGSPKSPVSGDGLRVRVVPHWRGTVRGRLPGVRRPREPGGRRTPAGYPFSPCGSPPALSTTVLLRTAELSKRVPARP